MREGEPREDDLHFCVRHNRRQTFSDVTQRNVVDGDVLQRGIHGTASYTIMVSYVGGMANT